MLCRLFIVFFVLLTFGGSASAGALYAFNDPALLDSAKEFRQKNYAGAYDIAAKAQETPARDFLLGLYLHRLEKWSAAADSFAVSERGFELLGDYALFYRSDALSRLGRYDEAAAALQKLKKEYPSSPLIRLAAFLYADALYRKKDYSGAMNAFRKFVESYPSGQKALQAVYQAALCREALGDKEAAAREIRTIWLKYPGSPLALQAEKDLQRLKTENTPVAPFTDEEIFSRGVIFYDLQKYKQAIQTFTTLSSGTLSDNLQNRVNLKLAESFFKARQYKDAAKILSKLAADKDPETACESAFWMARTLDRCKREPEAVAWYDRVADAYPKSELADDALFYAAMIRKYKGKDKEAIDTLDELVSRYPSSVIASKALWEAAWIRYLGKDYKGAATSLTQLLQNPQYRDRALYWLGRTEEAMGDKEHAITAFTRLVVEYPYGFYAMQYLNMADMKNLRTDPDPAASIPVPAGYERVKALITLGLTDEAGTELASCRRKTSSRAKLLEIARLYWEMRDYRNAMGMFRTLSANSGPEWNFSYPAAFSEHVSRYAATYGVPESLAYSIIRSESSFYPGARSPVGAVGLMQIMPGTANILKKDKSGESIAAQLTRPELNISLGVKHIKGLLNRYQGNLVYAVAAYNSGATPVDRWRRNYPGLKTDEFIENIPYPETREYVKKVFTSMGIYRSLYRLDANGGKTPTPPAKSPDDPYGPDVTAAQ